MLTEKDDDLFDPESDEIEVIYDEEQEEGTSAQRAEPEAEEKPAAAPEAAAEAGSAEQKLAELNDKYVRLYAEFDNYRKRVNRDKEDLAKYANEALLYELLPSLDHMEIALKHVDSSAPKGLVEGVEMTLRELYRTLEKFGLKAIEAEGRPFDPAYHHAVAQVERSDMAEKMVVEEMRKGFMYGDKVLRASMVSVSKKPEAGGAGSPGEDAGD